MRTPAATAPATRVPFAFCNRRNTEHRARSTKHGAQITEHKARNTEHVSANHIQNGRALQAVVPMSAVRCSDVSFPMSVGPLSIVPMSVVPMSAGRWSPGALLPRIPRPAHQVSFQGSPGALLPRILRRSPSKDPPPRGPAGSLPRTPYLVTRRGELM